MMAGSCALASKPENIKQYATSSVKNPVLNLVGMLNWMWLKVDSILECVVFLWNGVAALFHRKPPVHSFLFSTSIPEYKVFAAGRSASTYQGSFHSEKQIL